MLRQKTGPATIAGNSTSASSPSSSCSLTRCSAEPVPAASATLRPKGCQVPSARPARRSRKLASRSGWPSIIWASPPSGRCTVFGARSRYFSGTRCDQRSGGTSRCPSADISLYCLGISSSLSSAGHSPENLPQLVIFPNRHPGFRRDDGVADELGLGRQLHQRAGGRTVVEALAAAGAFLRD